MAWVVWALIIIYLGSLSVITIFCFVQLHLWILYIIKRRTKLSNLKSVHEPKEALPFVTIQLPIYNEKYVAERIIDAVIKMDYPKNRFEVQVLDDSTDATLEITKRKVLEYKAMGFDIEVISRVDRSGFKAGALHNGLNDAKGDYIAIFDADFVPDPSFLRNVIPLFEYEKTGVVQTRWGHINQYASLLTRVQAMQLNVHFRVEQLGRFLGGYFLQFNGTAGVWRKACIDDAGGWHSDTLTEDLDLSYRAQLRGWSIVYREDIVTPAELPTDIYALKSQQYRWMKGGAESARKLLFSVLNTPMNFIKKIHATQHLLSSSVFLFILMLSLSSVGLAWLMPPEYNIFSNSAYLFFPYPLLAVCLVYLTANIDFDQTPLNISKQIIQFTLIFPVFLSMSMAIALHNSIAVYQGYAGKKSPFVRTPKYGFAGSKASLNKRSYTTAKLGLDILGELILVFVFSLSAFCGYYFNNQNFAIFHLMLALGYFMLLYYTFYDKVAGTE